jgi:undecaprenyl diphosphate synthase
MSAIADALRFQFGSGDDLPPMPRHVAIIMDGNGRWAKRRGLPRFEGHRQGVEAVRRTVRAAIELGIEFLTIFSFSNENWSRPVQEVADLMGLLRRFIRKDLADLHAQGVRVLITGERIGLSPDLVKLLDDAEKTTAENSRLTLVIAFNYGGRQEIIRAMQRFVRATGGSQTAIDGLTIDQVAAYLDAPTVPDADLLIRTSGEMRISNFLLWQAAYAELVFMPVLWPEFSRADLESAVVEFGRRDRRFGAVSAAVAS